MSSSHWGRKVFYLLLLVAATSAFVVLCIHLDWETDRTRPMYHDVEAMADLQNELLKSGDPVVNLDLNDQSQAIVIDGKEFKPSDGVEIVVQVRGDVVCIRGANEYGDEATWQCVGGK